MINTTELRDWYLLESRQFYFQIVPSHLIKGPSRNSLRLQQVNYFFGFEPLVWKLKLL